MSLVVQHARSHRRDGRRWRRPRRPTRASSRSQVHPELTVPPRGALAGHARGVPGDRAAEPPGTPRRAQRRPRPRRAARPDGAHRGRRPDDRRVVRPHPASRSSRAHAVDVDGSPGHRPARVDGRQGPVDEVDRAIGIITREGEGSDGPGRHRREQPRPLLPVRGDASSGKQPRPGSEPRATTRSRRRSTSTSHGGVWPMAPVPEGGYTPTRSSTTRGPAAPARVRTSPTRSSSTCCKRSGSPTADRRSFWHAIETMFELEKYAKPLMQDPAARRRRQLRPRLPIPVRRMSEEVRS